MSKYEHRIQQLEGRLVERALRVARQHGLSDRDSPHWNRLAARGLVTWDGHDWAAVPGVTVAALEDAYCEERYGADWCLGPERRY